jgi:Caspase domain/inactive STAND
MGEQKGKRFALLVGVNRYVDPRTFPTLVGCVNDVQSLKSTLERLSYCEVICLHDQAEEGRKPTKENIECELKGLAGLMAAGDTLLVHFSCHGQLHRPASGDPEPVLILQGVRMTSQGLPIAQLQEWMQNTGAQQLVLSLDACHAGAAVGRSGGEDEAFVENVYRNSEGFVTIAASRGHQTAQETGEQGLYTKHLIAGLQGAADRQNRGFVTTQDIYAYILHQVRVACRTTPGIAQDPMYGTGGCGDIILADYQAKSSLLFKLEPNLYRIDYRDAKKNIDRIVRRLDETPGPALFLLQNEQQVRGDLCLRYLRNRLDDLGVVRREYPIGALAVGGHPTATFTYKLAEHLAIANHADQDPDQLAKTAAAQICRDAMDYSYCILSVQINQADQQHPFLDWFLAEFWQFLTLHLEQMQQAAPEATIVGIVTTDSYLAEPQAERIFGQAEIDEGKTFFDLPISPWTEEDVYQWLRRHAQPPLTRNECRGIADTVYQATAGVPSDAWSALEDIIQNLGRNQEQESA